MLLGDAAFPGAEVYKPAKWVPMYMEPIAGSGERLLIAVAAVMGRDIAVKSGQFTKLRCLFGDASAPLEQLCTIAVLAFEEDLRTRGEAALYDHQPLVSDVHVPRPFEALAISAEALASQWLGSLSSLAGPGALVESDLEAASDAEYVGHAVAPLPKQVHDAVALQNPALSRYFRPDLQSLSSRSRTKRTRAFDVSIDYTGTRIVANMASLTSRKPTLLTKGLKQKLWDLDAFRGKRVAAGQFALVDARAHELLLLIPPQVKDQSAAYASQVSEMLGALEEQADPLEIRVRSLPSVETIASHIVTNEAVAG